MSASHPPNPLLQTSSEPRGTKKKRKKGAKGRGNGEVKATGASTPETTEQLKVSLSYAAAEDEDSEPELLNQDTSTPSHSGTPKDTSPTPLTNGTPGMRIMEIGEDTDAKLEVLVKDREALRTEVTQLRQSLEELQAKHQTSLDTIRDELQETQTEKELAEEQYQTLLGKVNTIKAQLGERLKADAEDLAQARSRIEELEEQNAALQEQQSTQATEIKNLTAEIQTQSKELSSLRNRSHLSQQNWFKEREDLIEQEAYTREQYQNAEQAMREWEVLALEERSIRKDLGERVSDLEEHLSSLKEGYERATSERDSQANTVDGLQKALEEIQTARKTELREVVESSQTEADRLRTQLTEAQRVSAAAVDELETVKKELERALPFEKEVKEKNLLIGKLRHEAVTLNEHLTKALRFLKKGKPGDNVDRQIVTNHLLHFLTLDRSDPKKFQILQLIAALLGWTDEQREQAGLSRPGGTNNTNPTPTFTGGGSLRLPHSPLVHRTPSTPALTGGFFADPAAAGGRSNSGVASPGSKESLAELWQSFLEQESGAKDQGREGAEKEKGKDKEKEKRISGTVQGTRGVAQGLAK